MAKQTDHNVIPIGLTSCTGAPKNILDLEDKLLKNIFSMVTPVDLCSLWETCKRFRQITPQVFPKEYDCIEIGRPIKRILSHFGSCISTLSIYGNYPVLINWIAKYCGTLERLKVIGMIVDHNCAEKLKPIVQQLQALHTIGASLYCLQNLFEGCNSLTELEITTTINCDPILFNKFPKLKRFSIGISEKFLKINVKKHRTLNELEQPGPSYIDCTDLFFMFLHRHKRLRTLTLDREFVYWNNDFVHTVAENCRKLEELTMRNLHSPQDQLDCSQLKNLTQLRMLDVDIGFVNYECVISILQAVKSLEIVKVSHMCMNPGVDTDVVRFLSQLPKLRELHLFECSADNSVPISWKMLSGLRKLQIIDFYDKFTAAEILDELTNLGELVIHYSKTTMVLSEKEFSEIVKIVDARSNVLTLKCRFKFSEDFVENCNKNKKVKLMKLK